MIKRQIELALFHTDSGILFVNLIFSPFFAAIACGVIFKLHGIVYECGLILGFVLTIMIGILVAKWRARLVSRMQLMQLESTVKLNIEKKSQTLNGFEKLPRKVVFSETIGGNPPEVYQAWMLLNPFVWVMVFYFVTACTIDEDLRKNGQIYPAKLINASAGDRIVQHKGTVTSSVFEQALTFEYTVQGKSYLLKVDDCHDPDKYKLGEKYSVRALPNKPEVCEPIDGASGAKQQADSYAVFLLLLLNSFFELSIWYQPLRHRRLAEIGKPVTVQIKRLDYESSVGMGGAVTTVAPSKFTVVAEQNDVYAHSEYELKLSGIEYGRLQPGAVELALIDPTFKGNAILYRFCKYQVID